jgi:ankyrin repeat protein
MSVNVLEPYIQSGDVSSIKNLLSQNAQLAKQVTSHGVSPLMLACYYKKADVASLLLGYVDDLTLFEASAVGKFDTVAHLVYSRPQAINEFSDDGFTPLGLACYFGQSEIARYLVLKGADVNIASNNGFHVYPIHSAVASNQTEILRMLLDNNAKVNVLQKSGVTPLHSAAQNGNLEILITLLEHGADVNIRMEGGKLPADLANEKGHTEIAEILSA